MEPSLFQRLIFSVLVALLLAGCGGDTSWYVCSGTGDFCSADRDLDEEEDQPLTVSALDVARKTPQLIQEGLMMDGLRETVQQKPELISGWLMVSSLGLLVDDSDNASASRFLDDTRYWLMSNDEIGADQPLLGSGLRLLASVSAERDPAVAAAAASATLQAAAVPENREVVDSVSAQQLAATLMREVDADRCCDTTQLMAASVLLCEDLPSLNKATAAACLAAGNWLLNDNTSYPSSP